MFRRSPEAVDPDGRPPLALDRQAIVRLARNTGGFRGVPGRFRRREFAFDSGRNALDPAADGCRSA